VLDETLMTVHCTNDFASLLTVPCQILSTHSLHLSCSTGMRQSTLQGGVWRVSYKPALSSQPSGAGKRPGKLRSPTHAVLQQAAHVGTGVRVLDLSNRLTPYQEVGHHSSSKGIPETSKHFIYCCESLCRSGMLV